MFAACIPAHAAYFSIFEVCKEKFGANTADHSPIAAGTAGAVATLAHDCFMSPMDLCKQRLQLGYYKGPLDCLRTVIREEGYLALFVGLPTTLIMNVPHAMIMVATNESLKKILNPSGKQNMPAFLVSGAGAGAVAAAATCPLCRRLVSA